LKVGLPHRTESCQTGILCDSKEAIKGAWKQIEDAVLDKAEIKNTLYVSRILEWVEEQKKVDADEDRYVPLVNFIKTLLK